jgi:hypothetical protein
MKIVPVGLTWTVISLTVISLFFQLQGLDQRGFPVV